MVDHVQSHLRALAAVASAAVEELGTAVLDDASTFLFPMAPKVVPLTALGAPVWWQWGTEIRRKKIKE
jgi:hypothetical protein